MPPRNEKVAQLFQVVSLDAFVASSYTNVSYLAGTNIITQRLIPDRLALVLWPRESDPTLIICSIEEESVKRDSAIRDVRTYIEHKESPIQVLDAVIREKKLEGKRIGLEEKVLSARYYKELKSLLPGATLLGCDRELARMRMIKGKSEIEALREAALVTDRAIADGFCHARPGMSEQDIAARLRENLYSGGAHEVSHLLLAVGENTQDIHHLPGLKKAGRGDQLRVDTGGKFGNYYSDLARTGVLGEPSSDQMNNYRLVWDAVQRIIDGVRPGIRAKDVYSIYENDFARRGLFLERLNPHVGHGLGFELHEEPLLDPTNEEELRPGMVLAVEIAHPERNGNLCHSEDLVLVTEQGHEVLSRSRNWEQLLVVG